MYSIFQPPKTTTEGATPLFCSVARAVILVVVSALTVSPAGRISLVTVRWKAPSVVLLNLPQATVATVEGSSVSD